MALPLAPSLRHRGRRPAGQGSRRPAPACATPSPCWALLAVALLLAACSPRADAPAGAGVGRGQTSDVAPAPAAPSAAPPGPPLRARFAVSSLSGIQMPYWAWWVGKHVEDRRERNFAAPAGFQDWGPASYEIPPTRPPADYVREGPILTGFEVELYLPHGSWTLGRWCSV